MSISAQISTINVPFYGANLYVINHNGEAYTPMKPIVEGMGLDWKSQHKKLSQRFAKGMVEITIPSVGGAQCMICLALRKLAAWLNTISPNKVRPEIRDRVIQYQEECDDVLYEYWTKGQVVNPRKPETTVDDRTPLRGIVNRIMGKYGLTYQAVYKLIHKEFDVKHIDELSAKQTSEAIEYLASKVIEGEFIGRDVRLPSSTGLDINIPLEWWFEHNSPLREGNPKAFGPKRPFESESLTISPDMLFGESAASPTLHLTAQMESAGHDLSACRSEVITMRKIIQKLWPVVREVDAIRGSRQARFVRLVGKKGEILMG